MTEQIHICRWHHYYQQHFIFSTEDPAAPADRLCINIHSNKILLTPSSHLKHGPCGHRIFFFSVNPHEHTSASSASSFGYVSQVLKFFTAPSLYHLDTVRDKPLPSTITILVYLLRCSHASAHPTPT